MSKVTEFEKRYISMYLDNGIGMLPSSSRSDWDNSTEEQFLFVQEVSKRLSKFYDLYKTPIEFPEDN